MDTTYRTEICSDFDFNNLQYHPGCYRLQGKDTLINIPEGITAENIEWGNVVVNRALLSDTFSMMIFPDKVTQGVIYFKIGATHNWTELKWYKLTGIQV